MAYWCEDVFGSRWIEYARQPEQYVRQVAEALSQWSDILVRYYAEYVNLSDLTLLHESFGTGPYPEEEWSWRNVCDLLKRLPDIAVAEYRESGSPAVESSFWYTQLMCFLNEDAFPYGDGVWINFEGPIASGRVVQRDGFLSTLLDFEASGVKEVSHLSDPHANWLGRLAVLSRLSWEPPVPQERWQALHRLVEEFNNLYAEFYSLD